MWASAIPIFGRVNTDIDEDIVPGMRMCDWLALHDLKLCTEPDKENYIIIITKNSGAKPPSDFYINSQK